MASPFLLQIIRRGGQTVVQFEPGKLAEIDFIDAIVSAAERRGIGIGRTTAHVTRDIRDAINEVLLDLKTRVQPD